MIACYYLDAANPEVTNRALPVKRFHKAEVYKILLPEQQRIQQHKF
jgi:hypothetical protein